MKHENLHKIYRNPERPLPSSIKNVIYSSIGKQASAGNIQYNNNTVDYTGNCPEYTVRYLPVNFYKIWRPLMDLLLREQLKPEARILEFGCGPGTTTFGFIEFYRLLAEENPNTVFSIEFYLIEKESDFISILKEIWTSYIHEIPENLKVMLRPVNIDMDRFLQNISYFGKFDYIMESNLLNVSEKIGEETIRKLLRSISSELLNKHSSVILIEPSDPAHRKWLPAARNIMQQYGMTVYSPCFCSQERCTQKIHSHIDIKAVRDDNRTGDKHSFEYLVLRNDDLRKYECFNNKYPLSGFAQHIGEYVSFKAFIICAVNKEKKLRLKICDGSIESNKDMWYNLPKIYITEDENDYLNTGCGCIISVKKAKVTSPTNIECTLSTVWKISR